MRHLTSRPRVIARAGIALRRRDYFIIALLAVALATIITGDVARYMPAERFSAGI